MANPSNLPTSPADKNWPKGPNFKAIVWGFVIAIVVVIVLGILVISGAGKRIFPMKTNSTPSQTRLTRPPVSDHPVLPSEQVSRSFKPNEINGPYAAGTAAQLC